MTSSRPASSKPTDRLRTPTMQDVARIAGVSAITVSRALSGSGPVSAETLQRIQVAARKIDYVPDRAAGALKSGTSNLVAAIVPSLRNSLFIEMLRGLAEGLGRRSLVLTVAESQGSRKEERRLVGEFLALRPRGLVLHDTEHEPQTRALLARAGVPVVEVGDIPRKPIDLTISYSNFEAARAVTSHLLERGYRRIAFVTTVNGDSLRRRNRLSGYQEALRARGVADDPRLHLKVLDGFAGGVDTLNRVMALSPKPDAIFCANDVTGLAALLAARDRGLSIPKNLAIAGFAGNEMADAVEPRLTCLALPRHAIGLTTAEAIIARMNGETPPRIQNLGFHLIDGGTA